MVWPAILVGLGLGALYTIGRAGSRAYQRFKQLPPELFDLKINESSTTTEKSHFHPGGFDPMMTTDEAKLILGLEKQRKISNKDILQAHRKVMLQNHPDRGGSAYLAMKINQAREQMEKGNK